MPRFEDGNSFTAILIPLLRELDRQSIPFQVYSGNSRYSGLFASQHVSVDVPSFLPHFLRHLLLCLKMTLIAIRIKRQDDSCLVHNLGCGASLVQDVITAHACHRAWLDTKRHYGRSWTKWVNPIHFVVTLIENFNYRKTARASVIGVSKSVQSELLAFYPHLQPRLQVVPNGLSSVLYRLERPEQEKPSADAAASGLKDESAARPEDAFVICFAGNAFRKKGLGELIESVRIARDRGMQWNLRVFGECSEKEHWLRTCRSLGVSDLVSFEGFVSDLPLKIRECDLFCLPSWYESFGLVYLEAALLQIPAVGTTGVYPELMRDTGYPYGEGLRRPVRPFELFEAINWFATRRGSAEVTEILLRAHTRAGSFTEAAMVDKTLEVYASLSCVVRQPNMSLSSAEDE